MQKIKLFLASSSELKEEREQFEIFIYRRCKAWFERGIFLHLEIWEDFLDAMSAGGLQSEYNRSIQGCDVFVLLAFNKVGIYTAEEFGQAFGQFATTKKPFIFTYFKTPTTTQNREELKSLWAFEDKLREMRHYKTEFRNIEGLREHFGNQLEKLAATGFASLLPESAEGQAGEKSVSPNRNISGDGNKVYENISNSNITDSSKTYNIDKIDRARFE